MWSGKTFCSPTATLFSHRHRTNPKFIPPLDRSPGYVPPPVTIVTDKGRFLLWGCDVPHISRPLVSSGLNQRLPGRWFYKLLGFSKFALLRQRTRGGNRFCSGRASGGCKRTKSSATLRIWIYFSFSIRVSLNGMYY